MDRLTEIANKYGTDKSFYHNYTPFYNQYLKDFKPENVLEIGIFTGDSLRMWAEYFGEKTNIVGIDIQDRNWDFSAFKNIQTIIGDAVSTNISFEAFKLTKNKMFDLIIDDGSHTMKDQQMAFARYWNYLKDGGYFIMEDLHTSGMVEYSSGNAPTTLKMIQDIKNRRKPESKFLSDSFIDEMIKEIGSIELYENEKTKSKTSIIRKVWKV